MALLKDVCKANVVKSIGRPVDTVCSATLCVNNTLGDTLTIEVRKQVDQVVVLEKERTVLADTLGLVGVGHGDTSGGCVDGVLGFRIPIIEVVAVDIARAVAVGAVVG